MSEAQRFLSKTVRRGECLEWTGRKAPKGYGLFDVLRVPVLAHRYAFQQANGPIPYGMFVCHRCDNPSCVDVGHLFLGTAQENTDDMKKKGRSRYKIRRGAAKLTRSEVRELRALWREFGGHGRGGAFEGVPAQAVGALFNLSAVMVKNTVYRRNWYHV